MEAVTDTGYLLRSDTPITSGTSSSPLHSNTPASSASSSSRSTADPQSDTHFDPKTVADSYEDAEITEVAEDEGDEASTRVAQEESEDFDEGMSRAQEGGVGAADDENVDGGTEEEDGSDDEDGNDEVDGSDDEVDGSDDEDDSDEVDDSDDEDDSDEEDDSDDNVESEEGLYSSESSQESDDDADGYFSTQYGSHPARETELDATDIEDLEDSKPREGKMPLLSRSTDRTIIRNTVQAIATLEASGIDQSFIDNHLEHIDLFVTRDNSAYALALTKLRKTAWYKSSDTDLQALEAVECQRVLTRRIKSMIDFESQMRKVMAREEGTDRLVTVAEVKLETSRGRFAKRATQMSATFMSEGQNRLRPRVVAEPHREVVSAEGMGTMPLPDDIRDEGMAVLNDILKEALLSERDETCVGLQKRKVRTEDGDGGLNRGRVKRSRTRLEMGPG